MMTLGLVGGLLPAALFALHSVAAGSFRFALYALVLAVGVLITEASTNRLCSNAV